MGCLVGCLTGVVGHVCEQLADSSALSVRDPALCDEDSTGNMLARIFLQVAVAQTANRSVTVDCAGAGNVFAALFPPVVFAPVAARTKQPTSELCACNHDIPHACEAGLERAEPHIRSALQGAALQWRAANADAELDEAVIYVRCGDVLRQHWHIGYGWLPYSAYTATLDADTRSIGVLCAPLSGPCRAKDCDFTGDCRMLIEDLIAWLKQAFPRATVSDRSADDISTAFARMVLAEQTICNPSTFCLFPTIAARGRGYLVESRLFPFVPRLHGVVVIRAPFVHMGDVAALTGAGPWTHESFGLIAERLRA
jgi:hypothetical protein